MDPRLIEIRARLAELQPEVIRLSEADTLTDDETRSLDEALVEWDALHVEAAPLEARAAKVEGVRTAALKPGAVVPGAEVRDNADDRPQPFNVRTGEGDPYNLDEIRSMPFSKEHGEELRSRALKAVEQADSWVSDEVREALTQRIEKRDRMGAAIAQHALVYGSPEYQRAFDKILRNPTFGAALLDQDEARAFKRAADEQSRAAMAEGATTTGGFMVPIFIDPTIILTNSGIESPMRAVSTVKQIATQTWKGITSAGVTAEWTAEAAQAADASPTVGQPSITPVRADAYLQASFEMLDDTNIAEQVAELIADAKERLEGTAYTVGTGSTQPNGVITAVGGVTASRVAGSSGAGGAADFVLADVYAVLAALPARHRRNATWQAELTTLNKIRRFGEGTTSNAAFWAELGVATPPLLLGKPAYENSAMDSTIVSGSNDDVLIIGDFRKYAIVDRIGLQVIYNPLVVGANQRPTGEVGWFAHWRTGGDCLDTGAFRLLRL